MVVVVMPAEKLMHRRAKCSLTGVLVTWLEQLVGMYPHRPSRARVTATVVHVLFWMCLSYSSGEIIGALRLTVIRAVSGDFLEMDASFTVTRRARQSLTFGSWARRVRGRVDLGVGTCSGFSVCYDYHLRIVVLCIGPSDPVYVLCLCLCEAKRDELRSALSPAGEDGHESGGG
jgi:hypothetical protein